MFTTEIIIFKSNKSIDQVYSLIHTENKYKVPERKTSFFVGKNMVMVSRSLCDSFFYIENWFSACERVENFYILHAGTSNVTLRKFLLKVFKNSKNSRPVELINYSGTVLKKTKTNGDPIK